jgi:NAD(P)-dependent dehydrogenase (short-subunit alcohol dehydrogenase family)
MCSELVERTVERFGRLDILVNNAGVLEFGSIETTSLEQYDRVMNVNVRAIYHLTMLAVPHLVKTQGSIVNVSSLLARVHFLAFWPTAFQNRPSIS